MSSDTGDWITLAFLVRPRGLKGEIVADGNVDNASRFLNYTTLRVHPLDERVELESVWAQRQRLVFKFRGVDTVEQGAEAS